MIAATADDLRPPRPGGLGAGALFAMLVHGGLLVLLAFGVHWRSSEVVAVSAELWAAVPQVAAPKALEVPAPEPKPQLKPEPRPEPKPIETPKPVQRDADIALEKARLEKARERERDAERERERERERKARAERESREANAAADKKREDQRRADEKRLAAQREENLKRMLGQAGATGGPAATGTAAQSAGPSASYTGRIIARIKPNIVFSDEVAGNPVAVVEVRAAPDGAIIGRRLLKSSGTRAWDDAVLRAVDRTEVLPRDTDGRVPSQIIIDFRPRD